MYKIAQNGATRSDQSNCSLWRRDKCRKSNQIELAICSHRALPRHNPLQVQDPSHLAWPSVSIDGAASAQDEDMRRWKYLASISSACLATLAHTTLIDVRLIESPTISELQHFSICVIDCLTTHLYCVEPEPYCYDFCSCFARFLRQFVCGI